ncbi:DUF1145 domain-containing protein [Orbaceae bacterium ac157xtp]
MFIILGKTLYLIIWGFLLLNLILIYPHPANIIAYIALATITLIHGLQAFLLSSTLSTQEKQQDRFKVLRLFIFGVFEALSWKNKNKP